MTTAGTSWPLAILGIIALLAIFAFLVWVAYAIKTVRREMDEAGWEDVRAKLKGLSLSERFEVFRAVRFGRAVRDPALADVAITKAGYVQEFLSSTTMIRRMRRLFVLMGVTELAVGVAGRFSNNSRLSPILLLLGGEALAYGLIGSIVFPRVMRRIQWRAKRAEMANRELAGER